MVAPKTVTGTGAVTDARTRVKGIVLVCGATAGTVTMTDGNGGPTVYTQTTPGGNQTVVMNPLPADGVLFPTSCYVSAFTNMTNMTLFVG